MISERFNSKYGNRIVRDDGGHVAQPEPPRQEPPRQEPTAAPSEPIPQWESAESGPYRHGSVASTPDSIQFPMKNRMREPVAPRQARDEAQAVVDVSPVPDPMPNVDTPLFPETPPEANEDVVDVNAPQHEQEANLNFGDEGEVDLAEVCREMKIPLRHPREVNIPDELPQRTRPAEIDLPCTPLGTQIKVNAIFSSLRRSIQVLLLFQRPRVDLYGRDDYYEPPRRLQSVSTGPLRRSERTAAGTSSVQSLQQPNLEQPILEQLILEQPILEQPILEQLILEQPNIEQPNIEQLNLGQPADVDMNPQIEPMDIAPEGPEKTAAAAVAQEAQPDPTYLEPAAARVSARRGLNALFVRKVSISEQDYRR